MNSKRLIMVMALLMGPVGMAGPLQLERIDASADWLAHIDMDQLRASKVGQLIRQEIRNRHLEKKLAAVAQVFSFHPIDDISDVTLYGQGADKEKAVLMLKGHFDAQALLNLLNANPSYEKIARANRTVHSWVADKGPDAGQRKYGLFYGEDLIVIANTIEALLQATAVLDGGPPNCAAKDPFALAEQDHTGTIMTLAAVGISEMTFNKTRSPLLNEVDRLSVMLGENDQQCYAHLVCDANSADAARQINQVVQGLLAYGTLAQSKCPKMALLARATKCYINDKRVELIVEYNAQDVFAGLKEIALKMRQRQQKKQEISQQ